MADCRRSLWSGLWSHVDRARGTRWDHAKLRTSTVGVAGVVNVLKRYVVELRGIRWVASVVVAVIALLVIAWLLLVPMTDWLATHDVGRVTGAARTVRLQTARDAARGRLLTLGAGLFAIGALVYTARNFALSREGQVTDRYTKAIEQLGSGKLDVRIGGIYALERVARDSARDHPTVIEVLAAFVREHSHEQWPRHKPGTAASERRIRPDVQAAITVIGRRNSRNDRARLRLLGADLTSADLHDLDFTRADLTGANFTMANLTSARLRSVDLTRADLTQANLTEANLTQANLTEANLTHANLTEANLARAELRSANLTSAKLVKAKLIGAGLSNASLVEATLWDANLTTANLTAADFTNASLSGTNLTEADLENTDFTDANLSRADLSGTDLWEGARLFGVILPEDTPVPDGWQQDPDSGRLRPYDKHANDPG
jgi:uncharacterized protein YjbI with pentapeptide repeats